MNRFFLQIFMVLLATSQTNYLLAQCAKGNCDNGKGVLNFLNGDVYEGEFKHGLQHGHGKYTASSGNTYVGEWQEGKYHGKGVLSQRSGMVYDGEFQNGEFSGKGKLTWSNGDMYVGDFLKDKQHGKGKLTKTSGNIYEGTWVNGELTGQGKLISPEGEYIGAINKNKRNGLGKMTYANGNIYEGEWVDGKRQGKGKFTTALYSYDGEWLQGMMHGQGEYHTIKDLTYIGKFKANKFDGQGKVTYACGTVYEGNWIMGEKQGQGIETYADGSIYKGEWIADKKQGQGKLSMSDGSIYEGKFINNKFIEGEKILAAGPKGIKNEQPTEPTPAYNERKITQDEVAKSNETISPQINEQTTKDVSVNEAIVAPQPPEEKINNDTLNLEEKNTPALSNITTVPQPDSSTLASVANQDSVSHETSITTIENPSEKEPIKLIQSVSELEALIQNADKITGTELDKLVEVLTLTNDYLGEKLQQLMKEKQSPDEEAEKLIGLKVEISALLEELAAQKLKLNTNER